MGSDRDELPGKTVEAVHRTVETVLTPQIARYEPTRRATPYLAHGRVTRLRNSPAIPLHSRLAMNQIWHRHERVFKWS
jgi:hypothetical protein